MSNEDKVIASITKEEAEQTLEATPEETEQVIKDIQKRNRKNAVKKFVKGNGSMIVGSLAIGFVGTALYAAAQNLTSKDK